jgi:hypothetical protein
MVGGDSFETFRENRSIPLPIEDSAWQLPLNLPISAPARFLGKRKRRFHHVRIYPTQPQGH